MKILWLILSILVFIHAGCAYVPYKKRDREIEKVPQSVLEYYSYAPQHYSANVQIIRTEETHVIKRVEFSARLSELVQSDTIRMDYYELKREGDVPLILVSPILGGNTYAELFSDYFAQHGLSCVIVHRPPALSYLAKNLTDIEKVEEIFRSYIIAQRLALDWILTQPKVDTEKTGSFGISLGGIINTVLAGVDSRIKCHVIILAGGPLADILSSSIEPSLIKLQERMLKEYGLSKDEFRDLLTKKIKTDPLEVASYVNPENILMFIAVFDKVVPRKYGRKLWKKMGRPQLIYLPFGHYTSYFAIPYVKRTSLNFFLKKFGMAEETDSARKDRMFPQLQ